MSFWTKRKFVSGVDALTFVQGWQCDRDLWTLRVRVYLYDDRVRDLRMEVQGLDMRTVLDFDVLGAHNFLIGEPHYALPELALDTSEREVGVLLKTNSRRIDELWAAVGGYNIEGFQALALWAIRHRKIAGASLGDIPKACAALIYGEKELSLEILAEFEAEWIKFVEEDPQDDSRQQMFRKAQSDIAKFRDIVAQNRSWPAK